MMGEWIYNMIVSTSYNLLQLTYQFMFLTQASNSSFHLYVIYGDVVMGQTVIST